MSQSALEPRHLRSALEFAVLMAAEGQKFKPPMAHPAGLKKHFGAQRIPTAALASIRRMVEQDETFRKRIAAGALPELVDPIGRVWLARPRGWEEELERLVEEADAASATVDAERRLKKAEKRRDAAEQVAARSRAEIVVLTDRVAERNQVIDGLRSDVQKLTDELAELRAELIDTRNDVRHARDREASARRRLEAAEAATTAAIAAQDVAEHVRDDALADRAVVAAERSELARLAAAAATLSDQLAAIATPAGPGRAAAVRRKALAMPGGLMGNSDAAAEYLLRSGASVLVDGYNVAKEAWPRLDLASQRVVLLDAIENLVRRFGSDITVVFDGADVVGAAADGRRIVRVVFSPEGVIADDVIRDEVRRLPVTRNVVVVTNDQEIVTDTRAMGANTMSSDQLISLMR
jgi:predicted RNA-binding protein with PIN domain/outer membrane murein-binding lipoprotein Lpp